MSGKMTLERCFKEAEETGRLNLSMKNLRDFPDPTEDCELIDVIEIDLSKNKLSEFPAELCDFVMIEKVDMYHNTIRGVPESQLSELKFLRVLNLRRNQISSFPIELCSLPLQVLNLSNNKLSSLPIEIGLLTSLQDLDLSSNELSYLPNSMGEMISLKDLNLRRNRLEVLPDELSKVKLVRLDFSYNKVSVIPPAYRLITSISVLELAHNPLTSPPAQVCTKGKLHIFKYLSASAHEQEKRRTFDREVRKYPNLGRSSSGDNPENHLMVERVRRAHSLELTKNASPRENYEREIYRPSSLRERERARPPLSNVFETQEKRREIQKEIERAQQLISDARDVGEEGETPSDPDEEFTEGEELEKEFLQIEAEQRRKKEEEERIVEERRSAARKLQYQHEELQQRKSEVRRKMETTNGTPEQRKDLSSPLSARERIKLASPSSQPTYKVLTRSGSAKEPRSENTPPMESPDVAWNRQEEEMRARKREALMQQSRREAQLSRLRFEEQRQKHSANLARDSSTKKRYGGTTLNDSNEPPPPGAPSQDKQEWEESVFSNLHIRKPLGNVRSLPSSFRESSNPNFTIKRMYDSAREEFEQLEKLREGIESRLKVTLPDDLLASLSDGVVLCHLINHIRKGMIPSIHIPSAGVPKLTMPKCQKNVDYFLDACKKLGVGRDKLCTPSDILEEKSPSRVCQTVESLLEHAEGGV
ncbi:leucine-rich repeat and calponin homology domain-containing protein 1-like isoform X1 [Acropora muricata]|uniref:leucine-rich repeat and calponin homology domain-containing protein 1-like isoform X1 n=1 Tax=Acropora muricata TaxID=159855 RepID=UPI0034E551C9